MLPHLHCAIPVIHVTAANIGSSEIHRIHIARCLVITSPFGLASVSLKVWSKFQRCVTKTHVSLLLRSLCRPSLGQPQKVELCGSSPFFLTLSVSALGSGAPCFTATSLPVLRWGPPANLCSTSSLDINIASSSCMVNPMLLISGPHLKGAAFTKILIMQVGLNNPCNWFLERIFKVLHRSFHARFVALVLSCLWQGWR
jgi:hypothetical protein